MPSLTSDSSSVEKWSESRSLLSPGLLNFLHMNDDLIHDRYFFQPKFQISFLPFGAESVIDHRFLSKCPIKKADTASLFTSSPFPGVLFNKSDTRQVIMPHLWNSLTKFFTAFWFIFSSSCFGRLGKIDFGTVAFLDLSRDSFQVVRIFLHSTSSGRKNVKLSSVVWLLSGGRKTNVISFLGKVYRQMGG